MRVAIVMPPVTELAPVDALAKWSTVTAAATALHDGGAVTPTVHCRHRYTAAAVDHRGVTYRFHTSDAELARAVRAERPDVVHVHGIGWTRLQFWLWSCRAPIVVQHHGEPPFTGRGKWAHRMVRRRIAAYLFTGATTGQAAPWVDGGVICADAALCEVLEAASLLPEGTAAAVVLVGDPVVLWVGRLIEGKDPLIAIEGFSLAADALPRAHLHLLVTDRAMDAAVRARIDGVRALEGRVHLHDAVPHDDVSGWYGAADVFFSTSRREGSGYSLIEAMTCGCVPVVSAIPPHLAIVGKLGATFAVGDAAAAAAALISVATRPNGLDREPMTTAGRSVLSWGNVAGQLVVAYRSVTGSRN